MIKDKRFMIAKVRTICRKYATSHPPVSRKEDVKKSDRGLPEHKQTKKTPPPINPKKQY